VAGLSKVFGIPAEAEVRILGTSVEILLHSSLAHEIGFHQGRREEIFATWLQATG
jgi:hypothetical protein